MICPSRRVLFYLVTTIHIIIPCRKSRSFRNEICDVHGEKIQSNVVRQCPVEYKLHYSKPRSIYCCQNNTLLDINRLSIATCLAFSLNPRRLGSVTTKLEVNCLTASWLKWNSHL